jgi:hypothetical protein
VRVMFGWLVKSAVPLAAIVAVAVPASGGGAASAAAGTPAASAAAPTATSATRAPVATTPSVLVAVRAGRHVGYDRLVLEFRGRVPGHTVRYVRRVLTQGQGKPIPLAGRADLEVVVRDLASASAYTPRDPAHVVDLRGFSALRQVAWGGSFEGYTTLGVGVRSRLPIHVFVLCGPGHHSRLVIDVAQHR